MRLVYKVKHSLNLNELDNNNSTYDTTTLADGTYNMTVEAIDYGNNAKNASKIIIIDTIGPQALFTGESQWIGENNDFTESTIPFCSRC